MSSLRSDNSPSATSSVASTGSSLDPGKHLMRTLCFNRKSTSMPSKEDYALLLRCGLGARRWQVSLELDAETFRCALISIYPRLANVTGFSLWTLTKEKNFEKLPQKVNTPGRIKAYLGSQFTGCLIIMPSEEISLGPSPKKGSTYLPEEAENNGRLRTPYGSTSSSALSSPSPLRVASEEDLYQRHSNNVPSAPSTSSTSAPQHQHHHHFRQLCLVCGRMAKQQQLQQHLPSGGSASQAASFYNIASGLVSPTHPDDPDKATTIGRRLGEILRVELPKKKLVPSEEICKKCFRQLNEIDYLEGQLKTAKGDMINNFLSTISKIGRVDLSVLQQHHHSTLPASSAEKRHHGHHHHHHHQHPHQQHHRRNSLGGEFLPPPLMPPPNGLEGEDRHRRHQQHRLLPAEDPLPRHHLPPPPCDIRGGTRSDCSSSFVSTSSRAARFPYHFPHADIGIPQRVFLAPAATSAAAAGAYPTTFAASIATAVSQQQQQRQQQQHEGIQQGYSSPPGAGGGVEKDDKFGHSPAPGMKKEEAEEDLEKSQQMTHDAQAEDLVSYESKQRIKAEEEAAEEAEEKAFEMGKTTLASSDDRRSPASSSSYNGSSNSASPTLSTSPATSPSQDQSPSSSSAAAAAATAAAAIAAAESALPRQPLKKRRREISVDEVPKAGAAESKRPCRLGRGPADIRSNNDSGMGASDEDSSSSSEKSPSLAAAAAGTENPNSMSVVQ